MKVRLNLATSPLENHRRFLLGAVAAGVLALALLAVLSVRTYRNWRDNSAVRDETVQLQRELAAFRNQRRQLEDFFNTPEARRIRDRADFLNELIQQRSFPWTKIFMDLESRLPRGVRVMSISPRMENGSVQVNLTVGATSDESKVRFLQQLEESPEFSRVQPVSETRPKTEGDTLVLEIVAWYKSVLPGSAASPDEARARSGGVN